MDLDKERRLIEQARQDQRYFGVLFDHYYLGIYGYSLKRVGDVSAAQDITAETFFKAMTGIAKFKWRGISINNWFYKIATNEIRQYYRRNKYQPQSLEALYDHNGFELASEQSLAEEVIDAQTQLERQSEYLKVLEHLAGLPLKYQEVIILRFGENKKLAEIADILGKREGTVKSLLSRGMQRLRGTLEQPAMQPILTPGIMVSEGRTIITKPRKIV